MKPQSFRPIWCHHDPWLYTGPRYNMTMSSLQPTMLGTENGGSLWSNASHSCFSGGLRRYHCPKAHWHLQRRHALSSHIFISRIGINLYRVSPGASITVLGRRAQPDKEFPGWALSRCYTSSWVSKSALQRFFKWAVSSRQKISIFISSVPHFSVDK